MDVEFAHLDLDRLEIEPNFNAGYSREIVRAFRKLVQLIRSAADEREFHALKSLHFGTLKGERAHQSSMRLNGWWRLIIEVQDNGKGKTAVIVGVEDSRSVEEGS